MEEASRRGAPSGRRVGHAHLALEATVALVERALHIVVDLLEMSHFDKKIVLDHFKELKFEAGQPLLVHPAAFRVDIKFEHTVLEELERGDHSRQYESGYGDEE